MRSAQLILWIKMSTCVAIVGALFGMIGSWLVWNFLYGIGSRVISDEQFVNYANEVQLWGAIAGAISGFSLGVLPPSGRGVSLFVVHGFSVAAAAFVGASSDWRGGLIGFFAPQAAVAAVCAVYGMTLLLTRNRAQVGVKSFSLFAESDLPDPSGAGTSLATASCITPK